MTSVRDDVGQLLWFGFEGTRAPTDLQRALAKGRAGATIVFKRNLAIGDAGCDLDELAELTRELHPRAPDGTPALIAIDQEGGRVQRVRAPATEWPPMLSLDNLAEDGAGAGAGVGVDKVAEQVGRAMGTELAALGFDIDFAPVLDVHTNPDNPIIGDRAFARDPERAASRALAFARGLAAAGVIACGKHFPGHGDTHTDSHLELPRIDHDLARLESIELVPFRAAARAELPMIMTAHVVFAAIDPKVPATLSPAVIEGVLRQQLGYRGVIVSDDLDMKAIAASMDAGVAAVGAIRAGCDALLLCRDPAHQAAAEEALVREAERDAAFRVRVGSAATRVRAMKQQAIDDSARPSRDLVGCEAHRALARRLAGD